MQVGKCSSLPTCISYFSHGNIIKYLHRPFLSDRDKEELDRRGGKWHDGTWKSKSENWRIDAESLEKMNKHLADQINKMVGPDDELWHLGDFAMTHDRRAYYETCVRHRDSIKCRNVFHVNGNHDEPYKLRSLFNETFVRKELYVGEQLLILDHYCLATWNKSHRKAMHLYGHSHGSAESWLDKFMPGRRSMDVGIDNAFRLLGEYRPFSYDEIVGILGPRPGFFMDHHIDPNAPTEESLRN